MSSTFRPGALEQPRDREHRADAHLVGLAARDGEAAEDAERRRGCAASPQLRIHHHAGRRAVGELAGVAGGDHAARHRRADLRHALERRVGADALVRGDRDLLRTASRRSPCPHAREVTVIGTISASKRPAARAAAARSWLCTPYSSCASLRDAVALGDVLRGLQHRPVELGLVLDEPLVLRSSCWFTVACTQEIDSTPPATITGTRSTMHALRGHRDRLQARGAEAVDRRAGDA